MSTTKLISRSKIERAADHLRDCGLCDKELAQALGMKYDSLRKARTRGSELPRSYFLLGCHWTLIGDVERFRPVIVEVSGGEFEPGVETRADWIRRWARAHQQIRGTR